jgi:tetratricopeptide (TPR) repeat protein
MVRYPNYADVRAQIASLYYSHNYLKEAKKYYYEALKIYPYYHYARLKISLICFEQDKTIEAIYHLRNLRVNASHDHVMIDLIEKLVKEKMLYEEYLKDDEQLSDNYFKAEAQN